jgi:signal transduction histidine kinase
MISIDPLDEKGNKQHPLLDATGKLPLDVLHLEDNELDALIFLKASERCSRALNVTRVDTLADFNRQLEKPFPNLICADHVLPDGLASEAIARVKQICPEVPFIVITGAGEEDVAAEYLRAGAADYLSKKRLDLFPRALEDVIERYRNKALRELAEHKALRINEELLALIRHVEEERDEEKRSLSRDIHDQLGQELTALKLGLFWIQGKLRSADDPSTLELLNDKISELVELNTSTIQSVRNLAHSLRPVVLDQVGLEAGLESLVRDFNRRGLCFCGLHCLDLPDLPDGMRTDMFRIVQEGLTNISRHAEATLAYIRLQPERNGLLLEIGDNGLGMNMEAIQHQTTQSLGMVGMRERARNHQGVITLESAPNMGTSISIFFPEIQHS